MRFQIKPNPVVFCTMLLVGGGIGNFPYSYGLDKSFTSKSTGWRIERRAKLVKFRVPKNLKLTYNRRMIEANWFGKNAKTELHEFKSGNTLIAFGINHNMPLKDIDRPTCGNDSGEYIRIRSHKVSLPRPGVFRESRMAEQQMMILMLEGGRSSCVFFISWPFRQDKGKKVETLISRDDFKEILDSLKFVGARTDAGG
jgi:hypothetical protein